MTAGLTVRRRRFTEQTLREMTGKVDLARTGEPVEQQGMRPAGSQGLELVPVIVLPGVDHLFVL